jgi:serine phosphatase RsbU (regulator of sigma subunit)
MDGACMKIQTKFGLSSLIVLALLAVLVGGSLILLARAKQAAGARQQTAAVLVRAVHHIRGSWLEVNDEVNDLIRGGFNATDFEQHRTALARLVESFKTLESLKPMAPELEILRTGHNTVVDMSERINTLIATNLPEAPSVRSAIVAEIEAMVHAVDDVIEETMLKLIDEAEGLEKLAIEGVERVEKFMPVFTLAILGMIALVLSGQFTLIARPIVQSIQKLVNGTTEIGKGNLDYRLDLRTRDEIEQLGHEFNQMAANLAGSYRSLEAAKEQIEATSQALKGELEKGRQLQQDFLPYALPQPSGWELAASLKPARDVSGDFYDAFELPGGLVALAIGDVCDKGVGAALFMALCRSLLRLFSGHPYADGWARQTAGQSTHPGGSGNQQLATKAGDANLLHTVALTNSYIAQTHSHTNMFTTLFFGILDPATSLLRYINGGHEAPVILGPGGIKTRLTVTGPAVGLFPDVGYEVRETYLEAGDMLIAYTDGVPDARNPRGERFTQERLLSLLENPISSAAALLDTIEARLNSHIAAAVQFDDITLLAVRRVCASDA